VALTLALRETRESSMIGTVDTTVGRVLSVGPTGSSSPQEEQPKIIPARMRSENRE
jgi:hypothetical protein